VLSDVWKTQVYDLARLYHAEGKIPLRVIERPPSAELREDQEDQDSLPPYDVLDEILAGYVERYESKEHIATQSGLDAEAVGRVARMVDMSEYKRRQGPVGIKITPRAFGKDRRMPITNRYIP